MNIIIVGCGKVGQTLAQELNEEGSNITVIDIKQEKVDELTTRCDVMGITGNGATHAVQQKAGIEDADLLIAVTGSDELNLLCCLIARKAGNCRTIARIRSPQYNADAPFLKNELGLAMVINPEMEAAEEIARVLRFPSAMKIDTFASGRVELVKFRLPEGSPLAGCAVKDISAKFHSDALVCTIERGEEAFIAFGDFVFEQRDIISIVATPRKANDFFRKIKYKMDSVRSVIIAGGGEICHYLCSVLLPSGISVKVIEKNPERAEELSVLLDDATVIAADASDREVLLEAGLENTDGFVALTNLDEENILLSLFAKSAGHAKLVTKINRIDFDSVINHLDLDSIIYPKNVTAESIVRYVRAMKNTIGSNVERLYNVIKGKIEASEFIIRESSEIVGVPLMELDIRRGILVAAIIRDRKVIVPRGHDCLEKGDTVVIVSRHTALHDITDILKK